MRLVQLLSAWRPNGSLEADAIAMDRMLRNMGFRTGIYAKGGTGAALPPEQMPRLTKQDVLLYHVTAYADGVDALPERCRIGLVYHGLPPVRAPTSLPWQRCWMFVCSSFVTLLPMPLSASPIQKPARTNWKHSISNVTLSCVHAAYRFPIMSAHRIRSCCTAMRTTA